MDRDSIIRASIDRASIDRKVSELSMAAMTNAGGVFVIGVDTGVGKTTLCAGLLKMLVGARKVAYWKPVQTGTIVGDDTKDIRKATQLSEDYFVEPSYRFPDPLSPHFAARKWGKTLDTKVIVDAFEQAKRDKGFLIIEGA